MSKEYPCDNCGEPVDVKLHTRKHAKGIQENYMKCNSCGTEYLSYVTDPAARQMQREVKQYHDKYIKRKGQLQVRMDKLKNDILSKRETSE